MAVVWQKKINAGGGIHKRSLAAIHNKFLQSFPLDNIPQRQTLPLSALVNFSQRQVIERFVVAVIVVFIRRRQKKAAFWGGLEPGNGVPSTWRGIEIPCAGFLSEAGKNCYGKITQREDCALGDQTESFVGSHRLLQVD